MKSLAVNLTGKHKYRIPTGIELTKDTLATVPIPNILNELKQRTSWNEDGHIYKSTRFLKKAFFHGKLGIM